MPAYSGFWDGVYGAPHTLLINKSPVRTRARRIVNRDQFRALKELFDSLIGATSGGAALATVKCIAGDVLPGNPTANGGLRTITTATVIDRNTTAADVTALKEIMVNVTTSPSSYPTDASKNGGGGKAGKF